jgi:hypothetical protein
MLDHAPVVVPRRPGQQVPRPVRVGPPTCSVTVQQLIRSSSPSSPAPAPRPGGAGPPGRTGARSGPPAGTPAATGQHSRRGPRPPHDHVSSQAEIISGGPFPLLAAPRRQDHETRTAMLAGDGPGARRARPATTREAARAGAVPSSLQADRPASWLSPSRSGLRLVARHSPGHAFAGGCPARRERAMLING